MAGTSCSLSSTNRYSDIGATPHRPATARIETDSSPSPSAMPIASSSTRSRVSSAADAIECDHCDAAAQKRLVADRLAGFGWEAPGFIERMWKADDFYFDSMAQIRMGAWPAGRVVLVGDAAHCAAPLSGQGTGLALVGAYVLALELGRTAGRESAFARYERRMRPFVEANQALALIDRRSVDPEEATARLDAVKNAVDLDAVLD